MGSLSLILIYKAETQRIQIGLQNDTEDKFILDGEVTFNGPDPITLKGTLLPHSKAVMGEIPFDQINDYPHFEMELERHTGKGHAETIDCKIKPKPKHFINLTVLDEWGKQPGRRYPVWQQSTEKLSLMDIPVSRKTPSLQPKSVSKSVVIRDLSELAVFSRELDLHANQLFDDPSLARPEEIYRRQINAFQRYMDKAKAMNVDRVFIIHGVGSGRLKTDIANKLEYDHAVASYSNEHHPKYGFGATEVVFR